MSDINRRKQRATSRNSSGQAVLLSASGLLVVSGVLVFFCLLLLYVGNFLYSAQKVQIIASQCADYAVRMYTWNNGNVPGGNENPQDSVLSMAKQLLSESGLPTTATLSVALGSKDATVDLSVSLPAFGNSPLIPSLFTIHQTAIVAYSAHQPPAFLAVGVNLDPKKQILVPSYGKYVQQTSTGRDTESGYGAPVGTGLASLMPTRWRPYSSFRMNIPTAPSASYYQEHSPGPSSTGKYAF